MQQKGLFATFALLDQLVHGRFDDVGDQGVVLGDVHGLGRFVLWDKVIISCLLLWIIALGELVSETLHCSLLTLPDEDYPFC